MSAVLRIAPWLALLGVAWFGGCQYAQNRALAGEIGRLEDVRDSLARVTLTRDTVYTADTVTLTRTRWRTDSILLTDTLVHLDTVVQLVTRERAACDAVIQTCEERVRDRNKQIANLDSLLRLERKRGADWKVRVGVFLAGAAVGTLVK